VQEIDLTAQQLVEQMNAGDGDEAVDMLDRAFQNMEPDQYRQVLASMERNPRAEIEPTVTVKDWIMYTPWQGDLFQPHRTQA